MTLVASGFHVAEPYLYGLVLVGAVAFAIAIIRRLSAAGATLSAKDAVAMARDLTILLAIVLFFIGFVYRYAYLFTLGLPSRFEDASVNEVLVFSYSALAHEFLAIIVDACLVFAFIAIVRRFATSRRSPLESTDRALVGAGAIAAVLTFPVLYNLASLAGQHDASRITESLQPVRVCLHAKATSADEGLSRCMSTEAARAVDPYGLYHLLLASDRAYLFKLDESKDDYFFAAKYGSGRMEHFRLPKSTVVLIHD